MGRVETKVNFMIIKRDNREKKKLEFNHHSIKSVIDGTLNVGDYSAIFNDGYECPIVFERKSLCDLFGTLSKGYPRFKSEIERAKLSGVTLIIIVEGTLRRVFRGEVHSMRTPDSLVQQVFTIERRYGVRTIFCTDREEMSQLITHFFWSCEKEYEDGRGRVPSKDV